MRRSAAGDVTVKNRTELRTCELERNSEHFRIGPESLNRSYGRLWTGVSFSPSAVPRGISMGVPHALSIAPRSTEK